MATVKDRGAVTPMSRGRSGAARLSRRPITLYDLITALQDVAGPADDGLVVATGRHLLQSGRLMALRTGTRRCPLQAEERGLSQSVTGGISHRVRWHAGGSAAGAQVEGASDEPPERSRSITGKEVKRRGRGLVGRGIGHGRVPEPAEPSPQDSGPDGRTAEHPMPKECTRHGST
jgi:hypothetical protein